MFVMELTVCSTPPEIKELLVRINGVQHCISMPLTSGSEQHHLKVLTHTMQELHEMGPQPDLGLAAKRVCTTPRAHDSTSAFVPFGRCRCYQSGIQRMWHHAGTKSTFQKPPLATARWHQGMASARLVRIRVRTGAILTFVHKIGSGRALLLQSQAVNECFVQIQHQCFSCRLLLGR